MKKNILIIVFALTAFCSNLKAQNKVIPFDNEDKKIKFVEVVQEPGTKDELFKRCVYWLNEYYKDPVRVTTVRDQATGKIMGRHTIRLDNIKKNGERTDGPTVFYEFTIESREGRYRYVITELLLKTASRYPVENWLNKEDPNYSEYWDGYLDQIAEFVEGWSATLKGKMKPEVEKVEEDW